MKTKLILLAIATVIIAGCSKKGNSTSENYDFEGTYKITRLEGEIKNNYCYIKKDKGDTYIITYHQEVDVQPKIVRRKGDTLFYEKGEYNVNLYILNKDTINVKTNFNNSTTNKFRLQNSYVRQ